MKFFFEPAGIAVVGATPNPFKGGNAILKNLIQGYGGSVYPVNPRYDQIEGLTCYPSVRDIPGRPDLAIVFVPAGDVLTAVEDCAAKGIPGVMIESGGFGETGAGGRSLQEQLAALAKETGIRLWGPNCMGLVDAVRGYAFSFMDPVSFQGLVPGNVSLVVQSGLLSAGFLVDIMSHGVMGISKVCSVGNKIDVNECDLLAYLQADPDTQVVGFYLESISEGRRFIDLCRRSTKPVVVLKGGKSQKGAEAAMSHTASLAGNQRVIEGVLAQTGVVEARDFKQMMDLCRSLALYPRRPAGKGRVAVLTFSGGAGIVGADFLDQLGLAVADLSPSAREALQKFFPDWMPVNNPVDVWPAMEKNLVKGINVYSGALKAVLADPGVDAVLLLAFVSGNFRLALDMADLAAQAKAAGKPVFVWLLGQREEAYQFQADAREYGVPVFQELYRAVECLAAVLHQSRPGRADLAEPGRVLLPPDLDRILETGQGPLDEYGSKQVIRACGIPTVEEEIVESEETCAAVSDRLGYPLVMKGLVPGGVHKTEMGLVQLGVPDRPAALRTFRTLMRKMSGRGKVLVQQQAEGKVELILGLLRDAQFGPCVMFGLGGVLTEVLNDTVFAMAPLTQEDALGLISRIRGQKMLDGFRGQPPVDRKELARIIATLGEIGLRYPRIREIDINPLIVTRSGATAVDATIVLGNGDAPGQEMTDKIP